MSARPTKPLKIAAAGPMPQNFAAQRIVTAARRHFFAHGFRSVTMDDLAEELGMSKKTLYASFASKTDLLRAVLLDKFHSIETDLERIVSVSSTDVLDSLHQLLAGVQRHTEEIQPPFVRDIRREAPEMFQLVQSRRRDVIQRFFGKILDEGRRTGIFRKDISTRLMIEGFSGRDGSDHESAEDGRARVDPKDRVLNYHYRHPRGRAYGKGRPRERRWGGRQTEKPREKAPGDQTRVGAR
jgi:AcrR family transcriptional regulator